MPSLIGQTPVAENYLKTKETGLMGTRDLAYIIIDCDNNIETNYTASNSRFTKVIQGIQQRAEVYAIGKPNGTLVTLIVSASSLPLADGQTVADGSRITLLEDAVNDSASEDCYVWNADLVGNSFNYD
jgi:hypothetical protein